MTYLHVGDWDVDANGAKGTLSIGEIDELGRVSGMLFEQRLTGWWSERARRLSFFCAGGATGAQQAYEGYAWDEPAETLLELGPKSDAQLVMPRLGEPVEPDHAGRIEPWWRAVDTEARSARPDKRPPSMPESVPWPID